jgi:hypothetical protein
MLKRKGKENVTVCLIIKKRNNRYRNLFRILLNEILDNMGIPSEKRTILIKTKRPTNLQNTIIFKLDSTKTPVLLKQ